MVPSEVHAWCPRLTWSQRSCRPLNASPVHAAGVHEACRSRYVWRHGLSDFDCGSVRFGLKLFFCFAGWFPGVWLQQHVESLQSELQLKFYIQWENCRVLQLGGFCPIDHTTLSQIWRQCWLKTVFSYMSLFRFTQIFFLTTKLRVESRRACTPKKWRAQVGTGVKEWIVNK